ncbi:MAG: septum formation protein Maf, partial [Acidobacteria bacterium]
MKLLDSIGIEVVLASASPRRKEILSLLFRDFSVSPSSISEEGLFLAPVELTLELAEQKARQVFNDNPESLVIGADTVVVSDGKILGKPGSHDHAVEMLQTLSGRTHRVITGVACICKSFSFSFHESTEVTFRKMSVAEIEWYVQSDEPFDKAGAYAIQGDASLFIERINGNYLNVVGFPLSSFYKRLKENLG